MNTRTAGQRPVLTACCGAHLIQDGLVALQYVLLPILAQTYGLSYAQVGLLRGISNTAMALLELPAGMLAEVAGERRLLALGLAGAGLGYLGVAHAPGFTAIALFFLLTGAGAALQHSLASSVLVRHFEASDRRRALGTYNSSGDAGKLTFTGLFSLAVGAGIGWSLTVTLLALTALLFGLAALMLLRGTDARAGGPSPAGRARSGASGWGIVDRRRFGLLGVTVFLDSTVQAVFLTFLAFILMDRGAGEGLAAGAVVLALAGGMVGKFCCGFLAARLGDRTTFALVQLATVAGLLATLVLPVTPLLVLLPLIGLVVQGSSTVTYGSVADFVEPGRQARGYALVYTLASASSVAGPFLFGLLADHLGLQATLWGMVLLVVLTLLPGRVLAGRLQVSAA